ncbi:MAG: hypothetical protein ACLUDU_12040 [Butyricimonas faecihominis]
MTNGSAQNSRAIRIYGEVTTVMNRKICGYITWGKPSGQTFSLRKNRNPYAYRDIMGDNVRFRMAERYRRSMNSLVVSGIFDRFG